jgi:cyclophilin family peptidyl-prolyl cis-trans isomerase
MTSKDLTILIVLIVLMAGSLFYIYTRNSSDTTAGNMQGAGGLDTDLTTDNLDRLTPPEENIEDMNTRYNTPPEMQIDANKDYKAVINTNRGRITVDLFEKDSPVTVNNFVFLARDGFYEGTIFHRVISGFMIQGGDPLGNGTGGPGYSFNDEFNSRELVQGSLAMANAGPNTNGSQFFIVTADSTPWLDGKHTNFGQVTEGLDIVMGIEKVPTDSQDKPLEPVVIESVTIIEE